MGTSRDDIRRWLSAARDKGSTHLMVVCDTFSYEDYPVYCATPEACLEKHARPGDMQKVMEVYDMTMDIEQQIAQQRTMNLPKG